MSKTIKKTCVTGMGIALFVVLSLCLQVPVFENYYLCLGYIIMAAFCYFFGPISGTTVGVLGVVLYCVLTNGLRGLPGWAVGNIVIGIMLGTICKFTKNIDNKIIKQILIGITIVISTAIAMLVIKSAVECAIYAQPFLLRAAKNVYAFVADVFVLTISFPIFPKIKPIIQKNFSELCI